MLLTVILKCIIQYVFLVIQFLNSFHKEMYFSFSETRPN